MRSPLRPLVASLLFALPALCTDSKPAGRLSTGCVDRSIPAEFCGWVVRYQPDDSPIQVRKRKSQEQVAIEGALREYSVVQPAQIQGARASVLVQRSSGEFAVVTLVKVDGTWSIAAVAEPERVGR